MLLAATVGPLALAAAAAGALGTAVQSGFNLSPAALRLNWQRLSPATGLARLAPSRAGIDTLKTITTAAVLSVLAWRIGKDLAADSVRLSRIGPVDSAHLGWQGGLRLLWQLGFAVLAIGVLDFGIQRWRLVSSLKMTRQEVQDETKSTEGNPQIKARVRRIQRAMVQRRMLQAVPRATVVLTNPTHVAVALEYRREKSAAPVVVAKGRELIAQRIREVAREHGVPIVENPPLARALFSDCEIGDTIPGPLFGAVAEVLAYLIRIRQLVL
jgi:flagellar biosynthetic protein FlhB